MAETHTPPPVTQTVLTVGADFVDALAKANAAATKAVTRPENSQHPGVSVFNPLGELAHPKATLTRETFWCGYRLQDEELTPEEVDHLNRLSAGEFRDGKWIVLEQKAQPGGRGRLEVRLPASDLDSRIDLPRSMVEICQEMLGDAHRATEFTHLSDAQAEITRLRALVTR